MRLLTRPTKPTLVMMISTLDQACSPRLLTLMMISVLAVLKVAWGANAVCGTNEGQVKQARENEERI